MRERQGIVGEMNGGSRNGLWAMWGMVGKEMVYGQCGARWEKKWLTGDAGMVEEIVYGKREEQQRKWIVGEAGDFRKRNGLWETGMVGEAMACGRWGMVGEAGDCGRGVEWWQKQWFLGDMKTSGQRNGLWEMCSMPEELDRGRGRGL